VKSWTASIRDLRGKLQPARRIFELSLGMIIAVLVCACSGTSTLSSARVVGSYPLSYAAQPTSLALGLGSLWIVVPAAEAPPAGQLAYGSLVRIAPETGKSGRTGKTEHFCLCARRGLR
jgi:hypothetical protein